MEKFKKAIKSFFRTLGTILLITFFIGLLILLSGPAPDNRSTPLKSSVDTTITKTIIINESTIQIDSIQIIIYGNSKN